MLEKYKFTYSGISYFLRFCCKLNLQSKKTVRLSNMPSAGSFTLVVMHTPIKNNSIMPKARKKTTKVSLKKGKPLTA
jgi:hypothetical protein